MSAREAITPPAASERGTLIASSSGASRALPRTVAPVSSTPAADQTAIVQPAERPAARSTVSWLRTDGPNDTTIFFDFDNDFLSLHTANAVQGTADRFRELKAAEVQVTSYRGSSRLSNGNLMIEHERIAAERANKVREILVGLGVPSTAIKVRIVNDVRKADGVEDPWSRRVTLSVKP